MQIDHHRLSYKRNKRVPFYKTPCIHVSRIRYRAYSATCNYILEVVHKKRNIKHV